MLSIQISNQKDFTTRLFMQDDFDDLLLDSAVFRVYADYTIDGRVNSSYFDNDSEEYKLSFLPWIKYRSVCFQMLKGTRKPTYFKLVFRLSGEHCRQFEQHAGISLDSLSVNGLFLNIRYDNTGIFITTGISLKTFSMDKTAETAFEEYILQYLHDRKIEFDVC